MRLTDHLARQQQITTHENLCSTERESAGPPGNDVRQLGPACSGPASGTGNVCVNLLRYTCVNYMSLHTGDGRFCGQLVIMGVIKSGAEVSEQRSRLSFSWVTFRITAGSILEGYSSRSKHSENWVHVDQREKNAIQWALFGRRHFFHVASLRILTLLSRVSRSQQSALGSQNAQ